MDRKWIEIELDRNGKKLIGMDSGSWILSTPLAQDPRSESAVTAFASVAGLLHLVRAFAACQAACSLGPRIRVTYNIFTT